MIDQQTLITAMKVVKRILINAHDEISGNADFMEAQLPTEADMANSKEYGIICRVLGVMEEQIASISNHINKIK